MSRANLFKKNKSKDFVAMNKEPKMLVQKRSEKARAARANLFDKNRDISEIQSDTKEFAKPKLTEKERTQELIEWKKRKEVEKQSKVNKKPFLPSGLGVVKRSSLDSATASKSQTAVSKSLQNSLTSVSSSKSNSLLRETKQSNPTTNSRVTRSQVKREQDELPSSLPTAKPTLLVDEQDLAWIPENDLGNMNLKVRRKSLRFSDVFSKGQRSPFLFRAKEEVAPPAKPPREPTILEDSVEISPISAPTPLINRNLLGAFSLMGDDTEMATEGLDCEANENTIGTINPTYSARKSSKEVTINETDLILIATPVLMSQQESSADSLLSEAPQKTGIELYSYLLQNTTEDLMSQRDRWKGTLNTLTEACDNIRSAIGQTDLLLSKKFPQYSGLIQDATDNPGQLDLETRCSDLQGFWDLILREVEDMQAKYSKLIKLAENGYQAVKSTHKLDRKPVRKVLKHKKESSHVPRVTRSSSVSLREQMVRGREQMKEQQNEPGIIMMAQQNN